MGIEDQRMAQILGVAPGVGANELDAFIDTLFDTDEPVITRCIRDGLPPEGAAKLSHGRSLKCPLCSQQIKSVPCVACNKVESDAKINEDSFQADIHNLPLRVSRRKTNELPGTSGKISVMRKRIQAGLSPFKPEDAMRSGTDGQENTDVFWPAA